MNNSSKGKRFASGRVLLAIAACVVATYYLLTPKFGSLPRGPVTVTATHMSVIQTALACFDVDCGRYPTATEGLKALITRPSGLSQDRWKGPYTPVDGILADGWGHDFVYLSPGIHNTNKFDLYSTGPDGVSRSGGNDLDDMGNWIQKRSD
jgi:general secretion pathway protein G